MKTAVCPLCHRHDVPLTEGTDALIIARHTIPDCAAVSPYDATLNELRADCPLSEAVIK